MKATPEKIYSYVNRLHKDGWEKTDFQDKERILSHAYFLKEKINFNDSRFKLSFAPPIYKNEDSEVPPIVIDSEGYVIDGMHRLGSAKAKGENSVWAWVGYPKSSISESVRIGLVNKIIQEFQNWFTETYPEIKTDTNICDFRALYFAQFLNNHYPNIECEFYGVDGYQPTEREWDALDDWWQETSLRDICHVIVKIGGKFIDLSPRQFGLTDNFFQIVSPETLRGQWRNITKVSIENVKKYCCGSIHDRMTESIKSSTRVILENYIKEFPPLDNPTTALKWALGHINITLDDPEQKNEWGKFYLDRATTYSNKYNALKNKDSVTIYRLIEMPDIKYLDIKDIGMHWSFEISGVGDYGLNRYGFDLEKSKSFVMTAEVDPKYIDWRYGFESFMYYGEDQWECALLKGAKVKLISIESGKKEFLTKPIIATVKHQRA